MVRPTVDYQLAKALHVIGFISWFSGLFYLVRLFIYHAEAGQRPQAERAILQPQLELMAARLWAIITLPAMILTLIGGVAMVVELVQIGSLAPWLHVKFALLAGLIGYTLGCNRIRKQQAAATSTWSSGKLRMFNEVATMFMVAIVFLAVFKTTLSMAWGVGGLLGLGVALMLGIRGYRALLARKAGTVAGQ
jgi:putative membrane protein